jgi:hypothetical protein
MKLTRRLFKDGHLLSSFEKNNLPSTVKVMESKLFNVTENITNEYPPGTRTSRSSDELAATQAYTKALEFLVDA